MLCFYGLSWYLKYTLDFSPLNGISPLCIISWRQKGLQGIWIRREQCQVARNFQAASIARLQNVFMWNKSIYKGNHCSVKENYFKSCFFKKCSGLFPVRKRKKHWKFQILIGWGFFLCFFFFFALAWNYRISKMFWIRKFSRYGHRVNEERSATREKKS